MEIDIPKYRKKTKKTVKKSNHKHNYEKCLIYMWNNVHNGERCSICGKINNIKIFETELYAENLLRMLSSLEILEKYKYLKIYDYKTNQQLDFDEVIKKIQ